MSYIKTTQLDGDVSVGRNVAIGGKANIAGNASIGHNLKVKGWLDAPNIKDVNKGIFPTVLALREAYPNPHDGWFAGVGDSTPFTAYRGEGGEWVATGGTINVNVDMTQFTEDLEQLQEDLEEGLGQLDEKKPDTVNIVDYLVADAELPVASYYTYGRRPLYSISGEFGNIYYIAFCMAHFNAIAPSIALFIRNAGGKYIFYSQFRADHANTLVEKHVALVFGGIDATPTTPGLMSAQDKSLLDDVVTEVFPVTVAVTSSNAGVREVGSSVIPSISLSITRKGADVSSSANTTSSEGTVQSDNKTIIGSALTSGTTTFQISVTQGGQTKSVPNQVFSFTNYRYKGVLSSKPDTSNIVAAIRALPKELSTVTTLDQTTLEANKYYLFAVKGIVNLVVKNAKSGGTISIDSSDKGTCTVPQENGQGSNTYSWVIVPASPNTWYFQIVNS